ncbi:MAG TPA: hypothetical protein VF765_37620 [Polyangiaceae bacterium]
MFIALTSAREAEAEPMGVEIALRAGAGYPLAFGLGFRAGASIESLYFGVTLTNYFPRTFSPAPPPGPAGQGVSGTETIQTLLYGIGLGYDFKPVTWLTIRPEIGVGFATVSGTCSTNPGAAADLGCLADTGTNPYIEPGVTGLFGLGTHAFVAANAGFVIVPHGDGSVVPLIAEAGVRF